MSAVAADLPETVAPASTKAIAPSKGGRPWTFYVLAALFALYVIALYGPMFCIYILSFQDIRGGLVFPMKGHSLHWFVDSTARSSSRLSSPSSRWWSRSSQASAFASGFAVTPSCST